MPIKRSYHKPSGLCSLVDPYSEMHGELGFRARRPITVALVVVTALTTASILLMWLLWTINS